LDWGIFASAGGQWHSLGRSQARARVFAEEGADSRGSGRPSIYETYEQEQFFCLSGTASRLQVPRWFHARRGRNRVVQPFLPAVDLTLWHAVGLKAVPNRQKRFLPAPSNQSDHGCGLYARSDFPFL
jgi:hypothetical protein